MIKLLLISSVFFFSFVQSQECDPGYTDIGGMCFHDGDLAVLQKLIDNSYATGFTEANCEEGDPYCGSPNPYMDQQDSWFWVTVDGVSYEAEFQFENGVVEPLELGLQEWSNGRLTSLMCGAYIYCQLSGPIPEEVATLDEISVLRFEYNYLSGFIPDEVCEIEVEHLDYLDFDLTGNHLCPPYPDCIPTSGFWSQDTSLCTSLGDVNFDYSTNILDVILLISFILDFESPDSQEFIAADMNQDDVLNILDAISVVDVIIEVD